MSEKDYTYPEFVKKFYTKNICVVCKEGYNGHGHNALPLKKGRCCDMCNNFVILKRIQLLKKDER